MTKIMGKGDLRLNSDPCNKPDQEETVGVSAIRDRMSRWPNGNYELIANAKHELFLETPDVRQAVMAKILDQFSE